MKQFKSPPLNGDTSTEIASGLNAGANLLRTSQSLTNVWIPIGIGILVNLLTTTWPAKMVLAQLWLPGLLGALLIGAGVWQWKLYSASAEVARPIPSVLLEFNDLAHQLQTVEGAHVAGQRISSTFRTSVMAASLSLAAIEKMRRYPPETTREIAALVLAPWIAEYREIFWFDTADAKHNLSVYIPDSDDCMALVFTERDPRIESTGTHRTWSRGVGHVGMCHAKRELIFSGDVATAPELLSVGGQRDNDFYRSMISVPIWNDGELIGVFIVTSSKPNQMEEEVHKHIMELAGRLLGSALGCRKERRHG